MSDETALMFPGIYPISRCDFEVQVAAKALLARLRLLESVWPTRDRIDKIFYNQRTRKIWVAATNRLYRCRKVEIRSLIEQLNKHGQDTNDCLMQTMFDAPHYRAITIDMRSPNVWRRRVSTNRPPRAGFTRVVVHVEPNRPLRPQLDAYMASF